MKIEALVLENFRRYQGRTVIPFSDFTAIIGKNDAGKSTLLEALDIFFGTGTKIDVQDLSINQPSKEIRIGVVFSGFPEEIDIDRGALTSLAGDHLLNEDGQFEVHKVYNTGSARIAAKTFAHAMHPTGKPVNGLLNNKNADLKKLVKEYELEAGCDLNKNPSMRRALYKKFDTELDLTLQDVSLGDGDAAGIWKALEKYLPVYALFKSDRVSTDQDPEAQNPMKAAVAKAVSELAPQLDELSNQVRETVEATAKRTIDQMKASYPDMEMASVLTPKFQEPKWSSIFKIDLSADDGVPINKRGSGVRRLILMSFFQAEANRAKLEKLEKNAHSVPVIYAVEEPETSQHPDNQARIVEALQSVVDAGDQVIITTHNPTLAELVPTEAIRFVDKDPNTGEARVRSANNEVLAQVVETLGVLPASVPNTGVTVAVLTEGKTDIDALKCFYATLRTSNHVPEIIERNVFWAFGGGSTVKDWVERKYLDRLGIRQVVVIDSDKDNANGPVEKKARQIVELIGERADVEIFVTEKREIENYLAPEALERLSGGSVKLSDDCDLNFDRIPDRLKDAVAIARDSGNLRFAPKDLSGSSISLGNQKRIITSCLMAEMTADEVLDRGQREGGGNEIVDWLTAIANGSSPARAV